MREIAARDERNVKDKDREAGETLLSLTRQYGNHIPISQPHVGKIGKGLIMLTFMPRAQRP